MIKKVFTIFGRDLKVNLKDMMALFIILFPILLAVGINLFAPGVNDTTVNLAVLEKDRSMGAYYEDFAKVEYFEDAAAVEERVVRRDNIVGILPDGDEYYILSQGNEPEKAVIEYAKLLKMFYELDVQVEDTTAELIDFGKTVPPLKKTLIGGMILMSVILGGMLITLNIVEEKMDNTVSAINLAPISRTAWIFGKSMIGMLLPLVGSYAMVLITGFTYIDFGQLTLLIIASTFISIIAGFIQGLNNDDVMSAVASVKMLMLPMVGSIVGAEIVADKWQWCFWWSPFYWIYKGVDSVLGDTGTWPQTLMYFGIVMGMSILVYLYLAPRIRKGLEQ